ncbi:MAG: hypothetical protein RL199_1204 [Pseudomonadota bacterium]
MCLTTEKFEWLDPAGFAGRWRQRIVHRTIRGRKMRRGAKGHPTSGTTAYGLSYDCAREIWLVAAVAVVQRSYRITVSGVSSRAIADRLNGDGLLSPRGKMRSHNQLAAMLPKPTCERQFSQSLGGQRFDTMVPASSMPTFGSSPESRWLIGACGPTARRRVSKHSAVIAATAASVTVGCASRASPTRGASSTSEGLTERMSRSRSAAT